MSDDDKRKRIQDLRRIGSQKLLAGFVIIFGGSCICFIFVDEAAAASNGHSYFSGKGLGICCFQECGFFEYCARGDLSCSCAIGGRLLREKHRG